MNLSRPFVRAVLIGAAVALIAVLIALATRQSAAPRPPEGFDPSDLVADRPDLDAPYVPTEHVIVNAMLDMGRVDADDFVIDLGSGDGRILIAAARSRGARGLGVDIDPARIRDSRFNARAAGVEDRVTFRQQDLFQTPIREASVLTLYLLPEINLRLRPRILSELRPGSRVVSHAFDMGDWKWDSRRLVEGAHVYLWIVPARVEGRWILTAADGRGVPLTLEQRFQELTGTAEVDGRRRPIEQGLVRGTRIRFVADLGEGRRLYEGRIEDGRIAPLVRERPSLPVQPAANWRAVREG